MGLCKTSNFSVFTFINASNLEFCTFLQQLCILHDEVYKGSNGKVCKMMTSHFGSLLHKCYLASLLTS